MKKATNKPVTAATKQRFVASSILCMTIVIGVLTIVLLAAMGAGY